MNPKPDPKTIAQKIAQQIAQEPFEVLKSAGEQVSGVEEAKPTTGEATSQTQPAEEQQLAQKLQIQGQRQLQALEAEMAEIRHQRENKK